MDARGASRISLVLAAVVAVLTASVERGAAEPGQDATHARRAFGERWLLRFAQSAHLAAVHARRDYEVGGRSDAALHAKALAYYQQAVELYRAHLARYPASEHAYEVAYYQGEALFFSERYLEAAVQYRWVRDHREQRTYFLDAARSVVHAYEAEVARQIAAGALVAAKVPTVEELRAMPRPLTPRPIPAAHLELQRAWDEYVDIVGDAGTTPQGINAALLGLAYLHVDDARARLERLMTRFCGKPEAAKAKDALIAVHASLDEWDRAREVEQRFVAAGCGDASSR